MNRQSLSVVGLLSIGIVGALLIVVTPIVVPTAQVETTINRLLLFLGPISAGLLALLKLESTERKVSDVDKKVNGHLARLTQTVVDSAATGEPVDVNTVTELASRTEKLTGQAIKMHRGNP